MFHVRSIAFVLASLLLSVPTFAQPIAGSEYFWNVEPGGAGSSAIKPAEQIKLSIPLKFPQALRIAESATPSAFLGVAVQDAQVFKWNVLDVTTGKLTPGVSGKMTVNNPVLSPTGKYLAAVGADEGAVLQIWPVRDANGTAASNKQEGGKTLTPLLFRGDNDETVVCSTYAAPGSVLVNIDSATGQEEDRFQVPFNNTSLVDAVSPDGKLLAVVATGPKAHTALFVVDLDLKKAMGVAPASEARMDHPGSAVAAAFSEDGKEVAALFSGVSYRLIVWDLSSGKVVADLKKLKIDIEPGNKQQGQAVQILRGGKAIRVMQFIVDRGSGEVKSTVPLLGGKSKGFTYLRMLEESRALAIDDPEMFGFEAIIRTVHVGN